RDPLQGSRAACIQAHPLTFVIVHTDGHTHPARAKGKRQGFAGFPGFLWFQQSNSLRLEINLHYTPSKEIRSHKSVHGTFTRTAQLVQIDGQILSRQFHLADLREHSLLPVAGEHGLDAVNLYFPAKLQPDSLCGAEIDDAHSSTSVHEEIERLLGLRDVDCDPPQPFP